ncbi:MAG TPA: TonB family protein [Verrucomicrobiae bacterium]|nr:TonB family protein [Verrucomicrobiae bacterium]
MNRLQKKCVMATSGFHLLLLVILFVGPAFFWSREKLDETPVLDMIPANLVDSATTGVRGAEPPPPAPAVEPPKPAPTPPAPAPTPEVVPPTPAPTPEKVEPVKPPKETVKPDLTPTEKPSATKPKINLTPTERTVTKTATTTTKAAPAPDNSKAIKSALRSLRNNLSSSTTIDMPGNSSAAAANYAQVVKSVYEQAWTPPDDTSSDDADIKVRVTIASDGSVISAKIISPSGDAKVDRSVRSTLERVQFIAPFPSGTSDKERTYIINFNLKSKRLLG